MRNKNNKHIGIRNVDNAVHYKLRYIAQYEGHSANGHILHLIRQNVKEFEAQEGVIEVPPEALNDDKK